MTPVTVLALDLLLLALVTRMLQRPAVEARISTKTPRRATTIARARRPRAATTATALNRKSTNGRLGSRLNLSFDLLEDILVVVLKIRVLLVADHLANLSVRSGEGILKEGDEVRSLRAPPAGRHKICNSLGHLVILQRKIVG